LGPVLGSPSPVAAYMAGLRARNAADLRPIVVLSSPVTSMLPVTAPVSGRDAPAFHQVVAMGQVGRRR